MIFELTNEQRYYLGLTQVEESWEQIRFNERTYLYFCGEKLVKSITVKENMYHEKDLDEITAENRTLVLPKTSKGKVKKLNYTALTVMKDIGVYFRFDDQSIMIGNYTTQIALYSSRWDQQKIEGFIGLKKWLEDWIDNTSEYDMKEIELFRSSARQHCKYREGDYFAYKISRREYGFGRILLDVMPVRKAIKEGKLEGKHYGLMHLMGRALIVKIYKKTSHTMEVNLEELKQCEAFFSQPIMDNVFYYGEYKIIGNQPLEPSELEFPISYSRSISSQDSDIVYLQYGLIYKQTHISEFSKYLIEQDNEGYKLINPYRYESIGYGVKSAITERDLRKPNYKDIKQEIFEHFGLDSNKSYYENYNEYLLQKK